MLIAFTLSLIAGVGSASAKDTPLQTVLWPTTGEPVLRFTFDRNQIKRILLTQRDPP